MQTQVTKKIDFKDKDLFIGIVRVELNPASRSGLSANLQFLVI
jgi:hypothetical protein